MKMIREIKVPEKVDLEKFANQVLKGSMFDAVVETKNGTTVCYVYQAEGCVEELREVFRWLKRRMGPAKFKRFRQRLTRVYGPVVFE